MIIVSHSGRFHCDDVFAVATLKMLPDFCDAKIVRARDRALIAEADVVVDVGLDYDPDTNRFDHHQSPRPMAPEGYPYSAFGLVWVTYGAAVIDQVAPGFAPDVRNAVAKTLALGFIRAIDLADNGLGESNPANLGVAMDMLNYSNLNDEPKQYTQFELATEFARHLLIGYIEDALRGEIDTRAAQREISAQKDDIARTGIAVFSRNLNWRNHIVHHNDTSGEPRINFVLEPRHDGLWGLTVTTVAVDSFISHRLLPENLRGRTPEIIALLSGVKNVEFIHANGFYSCGDKDAMLQLASMSVPDPRAQI